MKNVMWIPIGVVAGLASGALYGIDFALAGGAIGLTAGIGIYYGLRVTEEPKNRRRNR